MTVNPNEYPEIMEGSERGQATILTEMSHIEIEFNRAM